MLEGVQGDPTRWEAKFESEDDVHAKLEILDSTRAHRRAKLQQALSDWPESDLTDFGRLLKEFNASLDRLLVEEG